MMTIKELQDQARELSDAQSWHDTSIEERAAFLVGEVHELAEEARRLAALEGGADREGVKEKLGMEMYDVVWNICDLANIVGLDLEEVFARKHAINRNRQWKNKARYDE